MKKYFTILVFLSASLCSHAQQITVLEYFYDSDPGIGNGQAITLNSAQLDSTFQFNLSGLTPGLHRVGFRLKNSNNKWGSTTWNSFNLFTGTAGTPQIKQIEYFWNNDAGISQNTIVPVLPSANIDTTISVVVPTGGALPQWIGARTINRGGDVGNTAYDTANICSVFAPKAGFYVARDGNNFSCVDTTNFFGTQRSLKWYISDIYKPEFDNSKVLNYDATFPILAGIGGAIPVKLVSGIGCNIRPLAKFI